LVVDQTSEEKNLRDPRLSRHAERMNEKQTDEKEMDERRTVKVSKYLSKHLRHQPERIGLTLDASGWVEIDDLLAATAAHNFRITREELDHVVASNDKKRFAIEGTRIRASQGHSIKVDLALPPATPPAYLYHGTVAANLDAIRAEGLRPMNRHDVHLSPDRETATRVGLAAAGPSCSPWTPVPCTATAMSSTSARTGCG